MKTRLFVTLLCLGTITLFAQNSSVEITAEPSHHQVLENEYVRAFKVEVPPHGSTLMHHHGHDYFYVIFGPVQIENSVAGKSPAVIKLQDGEARYADGNFDHQVKDLLETPFRNVTVELMQDEKARKNPPPKWDEERGVDVFDGGTREILFVKDGVRVSQIDMQPGAMIPSHHHKGPHLVIAVSDLELRSDVEGRGPATANLKSGDVKWVPGGFTHKVMNVGKAPAKFVTLEFQ